MRLKKHRLNLKRLSLFNPCQAKKGPAQTGKSSLKNFNEKNNSRKDAKKKFIDCDLASWREKLTDF